MRAASRMTGAAKNTVIKLLRELGRACLCCQEQVLRNPPCGRLQVDEIWSFVYAGAKNIPVKKACDPFVGDVWTWTAIDADTRLVPCWVVGGRDAGGARDFMGDLAARLAHRVQLTSDGHQAYLDAVDQAFGDGIDYAMLMKIYGRDGNPNKPEAKYSPGKVNGTQRRRIKGDPNPMHVSTSYAERQNLTMRMQMRRFTRLTNGFSKKIENHCHAIARHFMFYNFARVHRTLKTTPAMGAGVTDHVWTVEEIVGVLPN